MSRAVLFGLLVAGLCTGASGQELDLPSTNVLDIYLREPWRINRQPSPGRIAPLAVSVDTPSSGRVGQLVPVEELALRTNAFLSASRDKMPAVSDDAAENTEEYFSLAIGGRQYVLDIVETVWDPVFEAFHILAAIANGASAAYARFTIDPVSGAVVGTIDTGAQRYRIVSSDDLASQRVFRLDGVDRDERVTSEGLVAPEIVRLERRHAQAERVAEIQPEIFTAGANGYGSKLVGGDLGTVPLDEIESSEGIARLLKNFAVFTHATGAEEFEIVYIQPEGDGRRIRYRQVIAGIPIDTTALIDVGPTGEVRRVASVLVDPSIAPDPDDLLSHDEAQSLIEVTIAQEFPGYRVSPPYSSEPAGVKLELSFRVASKSPTDPEIVLVPIWRTSGLALSDGTRMKFVVMEINALDGTGSIVDPVHL